MATNAGIAAVVASMIWLVGVGPFLLVHLPIVVPEPFALVHCQYRHSPHPSFVQPHPFYRLPLVLRDHPDLDGIGRLTLLQSLRSVRLVLWGRRSATARLFPRGAPALCFNLKVILRRDWE